MGFRVAGSLAVLALLEEEMGSADGPDLEAAIERVRPRCVFTTHTPVPTATAHCAVGPMALRW